MNRMAWLQERRMETFQDVLERFETKRLSAIDAAELLGMSESSFRRYRLRCEEEGLEGLFDRRLGKVSARRAPVDQVIWMLKGYRTRQAGWTVKHFHDHLRDRHGLTLSCTWTKTTLQRAGLVARALRRGAHRHEAALGRLASRMAVRPNAARPALDNATSETYSAFLVEKEGAPRPPSEHSRRCSRPRVCPGSSTPTAAVTTSTLPRRGVAPSAPSAPSRTAWSMNSTSPASPATRLIQGTRLPDHHRHFAIPPELEDSAFVPLVRPEQIDDILCLHAQRIVGHYNIVRYDKRFHQLPTDPDRPHYFKAHLRI